MEDLIEVIGYVNTLLYVVLAVAAFRSWRRQGGESAGWVAGTFGILAVIGLASLVLPEDPEDTPAWVTKLLLFGIVFFPYGLYRFTSSLRRSSPKVDKLALAATGIIAIWTLFLSEFPGPDEPREPVFQGYVFGLLIQWGGLLVTVAVRLWGAGKGQPTLARRRMRILSLGSIGMTLALLVSGTQTGEVDSAIELTTAIMAGVSVLFFFLGFTPPPLLRMAWRRPEQEALAAATERLVSATTEQEVVDSLLPHVTKILGARAAILTDTAGRTLGSHGEPAALPAVDEKTDNLTEETVQADLLRLDFDFGSLIIWASPYTPFFGQEEVELLRALGVLTGLALDRTGLYRREQEARAAAEEANRRLQEAYEGLTKSQAQLAEAQSIARLGSFSWNVADDVIAWSDEMYRIHGEEPGSFDPNLGSTGQFVHPEDRERVNAEVEQAMGAGQPYSLDYRIVRTDGEVRTLHARASLELDRSGAVARVVGTVQDVTEAREAERRIASALESEREARRALEDLNAEMESFVYTVSHDLNSPIIAIQGFSDFLSKDFGESLPEKGRFYIERIAVSAAYLQSLIKDLLQFSRIGRSQTEPEEVSLQDIVAQSADEVRAGFPNLEVEAVGLPDVHMNPLRARQLFTNLMQNSCRYAGREDVHIWVTADRRDGNVLVSVRDNGPGIPKEHHLKVFGVFERLNQAGKTEGSGMGLPICKKIVETAGGSMWIEESAEGLDVRFTLSTRPSSEARTGSVV